MNPRDQAAGSIYPIMQTLAAAGFTDYWGFALKRDEGQYTLMTLATREAAGFSREHIAIVEALRPALASMSRSSRVARSRNTSSTRIWANA